MVIIMDKFQGDTVLVSEKNYEQVKAAFPHVQVHASPLVEDNKAIVVNTTQFTEFKPVLYCHRCCKPQKDCNC